MKPLTLKRKPEKIEVMFYDGTEESWEAIRDWLQSHDTKVDYGDTTKRLYIHNPYAPSWPVGIGEYVIRDQQGQFSVGPKDLVDQLFG